MCGLPCDDGGNVQKAKGIESPRTKKRKSNQRKGSFSCPIFGLSEVFRQFSTTDCSPSLVTRVTLILPLWFSGR